MLFSRPKAGFQRWLREDQDAHVSDWLLTSDSRQSEKGTRCGTSGTVLAFKTAPEEVCHHSKTEEDTILRSYGELGLELPTQVESKIERKSEQNSLHDLLVISALQRLENTEAGHAPEGQSSIHL